MKQMCVLGMETTSYSIENRATMQLAVRSVNLIKPMTQLH